MKKIWFAVKLAGMLLLYAFAVRYSNLAENSADTATVMLENSSLTGKDAEEICAREAEQDTPIPLCFWGEREEAALSCKETGGSSIATEIISEGKQELIVPGGQSPILQRGECLIDKETAWDLFRTDFALGQTLWCDGEAYRVCGTFESLERIFIHRAGQNFQETQAEGEGSLENPRPGAVLDHISLRTGSSGDAEQFLMRYGLTGTRIDFTFLNILVQDLLLLLPLILAGKLLWILGKGFWEEAQSRGGKICVGLACGGIFLAVLFLFRGNLKIPSDMIPTKWSDFSFWTDWWSSQCKNFLRMLGSAQGEVQLMMLWKLLISLACNLAGVFLALTLSDGPAKESAIEK